MHHKLTPGGAIVEKKPTRPRTSETNLQDTYLQVGQYLLEQFAIPAFRSCTTIGLVNRDRIQFCHANHSVILVSSGISFSPSDPRHLSVTVHPSWPRLRPRSPWSCKYGDAQCTNCSFRTSVDEPRQHQHKRRRQCLFPLPSPPDREQRRRHTKSVRENFERRSK